MNFVFSLFLDFALGRTTLAVFCPSAFPSQLSSCLLVSLLSFQKILHISKNEFLIADL